MKTLLFLLILFYSGCLTSSAQKKYCISYGAGVAVSNTHNKIAAQLTADGIADVVILRALFEYPGTEQHYPHTNGQTQSGKRTVPGTTRNRSFINSLTLNAGMKF